MVQQSNHEELKSRVAKAHLNPIGEFNKDSEASGYLGQNGLYNLDFDLGGYFIPGLGSRRGLL